ncbi:MAG: hypothetical protein EA369_06525 [Bradymonadales bacterium]|nr:MAG: hypothetical protein EA369_06525 [Bradymonadales bacterium]
MLSSSVLFWFALLLLIVAARIVYWLEPFGISVDEHVYLAVAEAWSHYGSLYLDAVDRKPPLFLAIYRVIGELFGFFNVHAIHLSFILFVFLLCMLGEKISQQLSVPPPKGVTAILIALYSSSFSREFTSANTEIPMVLALFLSFLFLLKAINSPKQFHRYIFVSAVVAALATLIKQNAFLPYALAILSFPLIPSLRAKSLRAFFVVGLGVGLVYSATVLVFWSSGTLGEFLQWTLWDNLGYMTHHTVIEQSRPWISPFLICIALWPALSIGIGYQLITQKMSPGFAILLAGSLGAILFIVVSGRLYSHYFVPAAFFLSLTSAFGVFTLSKARWGKAFGVLVVLPFFIFFMITTFRDAIFPVFNPGGKIHSFDLRVQEKIREASRYIKETTSQDDRIVVWGMAAQIYTQSQRGSATRFILADYVSGRLPGHSTGERLPNPDHLRIYLEDMKRNQPVIFVDTHPAAINDYEHFPLNDYPELFSFVEEHFDFEGFFGKIGIWRKKGFDKKG